MFQTASVHSAVSRTIRRTELIGMSGVLVKGASTACRPLTEYLFQVRDKSSLGWWIERREIGKRLWGPCRTKEAIEAVTSLIRNKCIKPIWRAVFHKADECACQSHAGRGLIELAFNRCHQVFVCAWCPAACLTSWACPDSQIDTSISWLAPDWPS